MLFEQEILEGMDDTCMKSGFLKCAVSSFSEDRKHIHPVEHTTVTTCAEVAAKYGMSIHMHTASIIPAELILEEIDIMLGWL